jgi:hypothetical protein
MQSCTKAQKKQKALCLGDLVVISDLRLLQHDGQVEEFTITAGGHGEGLIFSGR